MHNSQRRSAQNKINILYIINESEVGGAAQSLLDMLAVSNDRISPTIIIPSAGIIEERLRQMNLEYYIVPFQTDHRKIGTGSDQEIDQVFASNYAAALRMQKIIKGKKTDIIHTNSSVSNVGAIAALMAGIPHVWHIRELLEEHFEYEFLDKKLKKELFACADKIIAVSECVKNAYKDKYAIEAVRIYNGVNTARFLCEKVEGKKENCYLLAGVISPKKGQLDAVKAVQEIIRRGRDIQLYIVGTGSYQDIWLLKKYVNKHGLERNIHFLDFKNDLRQLREKCLYSITSSKMEALGRVTIEAMMAGCVVIGADTGGTAEIIGSDCSRGYLYRQGNYKDLANVMLSASENRENNLKIQKHAQKYAVDTFDVKKYQEQMIQLYEEVLVGSEDFVREQKVRLLHDLDVRYSLLQDKTDYKYSTGGFGKQQMFQKILQRWLCNKLENRFMETALLDQGIGSVAIYGMGYLGCCLYDELENSRITVKYVMDQRIRDYDFLIKIVDRNEILPEVDAIVITVQGEVRRLIEFLKAKCNYRIVTISELLDWCETI